MIQADGSEIVIKNAAVNIPTFIVDGVVVSTEVFEIALNTNGIDIAAGPNGTLVAVSGDSDSSGANFFIKLEKGFKNNCNRIGGHEMEERDKMRFFKI